MKFYVYLLQNRLDHKVFIDCSLDPEKAWQQHQQRASKNDKLLPNLFAAITKDGAVNFTLTVLEEHGASQEARSACDHLIALHNSSDEAFGYNQRTVKLRDYPTPRKEGEPQKRQPLSDEHKQKISESNKGKKRSEEAIQKTKDWWANTDYVHSDETRKKISEANKGRKMSEKQRQKQSERMMGNTYGVGIVLSEERRQQISENMKGKNTWMTGTHLSDETKRKLSDHHILNEVNVGEKNGMYGRPSQFAKLSQEQADMIRIEYATGRWLMKELGEKYSVSRQIIGGIISGKTYRGYDKPAIIKEPQETSPLDNTSLPPYTTNLGLSHEQGPVENASETTQQQK